MTNPNLRHIEVILDRSGSMQSVKDDTEGGLRAFLAEQGNVPIETTVSLRQFDDRYETVYDMVPLAGVPDFTLRPRGSTALLDAVGKTIAALGERLDSVPEDDRPGEIIVVILTDGQENASTEWSLDQVKAAITRQQDDYQWRFVFLGANQDAFAAAGGMGIRGDTVLSYGGDKTSASMAAAGAMVARGTRSGVYGFTDDERDASK